MAKQTKSNQNKGSIPKWMLTMNTVKVAIHTGKEPLSVISQVRAFGPTNLFDEVVGVMYSVRKLSKLVFSKENTLKDIDSFPVFSKSSDKRQFKWAISVIKHFKEDLSKFIFLSSEFENNFLLGNWDRCKALLNEIENETGQSVWLIKNRISLEHVAYGLEANKEILSEILNTSEEGGLVGFIAHYTSQRNEESISPNRFVEDVSEHLPNNNLDKVAFDFLAYHVIPDVRLLNINSLMNVLHFSMSISAVDLYEAFVNIARIIISKNLQIPQVDLSQILQDLYGIVEDKRVLYILSDLGVKVNFKNSFLDSYLAFEYLLNGQFKLAGEKAAEILAKDPSDIYMISIYAKSSMFTTFPSVFKHDSFLYKTIEAVRNMLLKNEHLSRATTFLLRSSLNFFSFNWADFGKSLITQDTSYDPLEKGEGAVFYSYSGLYPHPIKINYCNDESIRGILCDQLPIINASPAIESYTLYSTNLGPDKEPDFLFREEAVALMTSSSLYVCDYDLALKYSSELSNSPYPVYRDTGIKVKSFCLLMLGKVEECLDYTTSVFIREPKAFYILPIEKLLEVLDEPNEAGVSGSIAVPILYDIYIKNIREGIEYKRAYAFEDFLNSYQRDKPSELRMIIDKFEISKLIYFLRFICIESIMDVSTSFSSSQELIDERLEVCRLLCEIDFQNSDIYQEEIKAIVKAIAIKKKVRQVEQSKIYVDVPNIKLLYESNVKEYFDRHISLVSSNVKSLATLIRKNDKSFFIIAPARTEIDALFASMIAEMRDTYVFNSKHGLDGYLSVRIRHGTLSSQLRSIFEPFQLVTQIDSLNNEYKANTYWLEELSTPEHSRDDLIASFNKFSLGIDSIIDTALNEWVRIKSKDSDKGLFDFTVQEQEFKSLQSKINNYTVFGEFINIVLDFLNQKLESSLSDIRKHIDIVITQEITSLVNQLYAEVEKVSDSNTSAHFRARNALLNTTMQSNISRIKEWFRLPKSATSEPFFIEEAISISLTSVKSSHPFELEFEEIDKDNQKEFDGTLLPVFVDIFCIIFENIKSHSGSLQSNKAFITLKFLSNTVSIKVENELENGVINAESERKIALIKSSILSDSYIGGVRSEGGTGFYKIRKLFLHDFKSNASETLANFDFGFIEGPRFFVEMEVGYSNNILL